MTHRAFIKSLDEERLLAAIREAEARTSGEVRVFISSHATDDPFGTARAHFHRLRMDRTRHRNAVLLFLAPHSRNFAVIGDTAIHAHCGDAFWQGIAAAMTTHLRAGDHTAALLHALDAAAEKLALHFPPDPEGNTDELPNTIESD